MLPFEMHKSLFRNNKNKQTSKASFQI